MLLLECLDRRINDLDILNTELSAWQNATNTDQRQVDWQFTTQGHCVIEICPGSSRETERS
ncbi:hypothetical protein [Streptomyces sp. NBC_00120]|uniref:hypothetical protein n=1 Tax=Streptomyces sp. NBC_00120 TaxID=2975660 RepID=UPI00224E2728|nr:hypothetical protein [Streptomyces sp. NBC_00120]MCX5323819.1 hypothetical protein [Streptomyces sp. NBC_00120]